MDIKITLKSGAVVEASAKEGTSAEQLFNEVKTIVVDRPDTAASFGIELNDEQVVVKGEIAALEMLGRSTPRIH